MKLLRNQLNTIAVTLFVVIILILNICFIALSFRYSGQLHQQYNDKMALMLDKKMQNLAEHTEAVMGLFSTAEYSVDFSNNLLLQSEEKQQAAKKTIQRDLNLLCGESSYISGIYVIGKDTNQFGFAYYTEKEEIDGFVSQFDTTDLLNSGMISVIYRDETVFVDETRISEAMKGVISRTDPKYTAVNRLKQEISGRLISCRYVGNRMVVLVFDAQKLFGIDNAQKSGIKIKVLCGNDTVYSNTKANENTLKRYGKTDFNNCTVYFKNENFSVGYCYYLIPFAVFVLLLPLFVFLSRKMSDWIVSPINRITDMLATEEKKKIRLDNIGNFSLKNRIFVPLFSLLLAFFILFCGIDFACLSTINNDQNKQINAIDKKIIAENIVTNFCNPSKVVPVSLESIQRMTANRDEENSPELYNLIKAGTTNGYELELFLIIDQSGSVIYRSNPINSVDIYGMIKFALEKSDKNQFLIYKDAENQQTAFWIKPINEADGSRGYMLTVIDSGAFSLISRDIKWTDIIIADKDGNTVYSSIPAETKNETYAAYSMKYDDFSWEITYMQPHYIANRLLDRFVTSVLTVVIILLSVLYVAVTLYAYNLSKNVNRLIDCMLDTKKFVNRLSYSGNEINCLVDTYNQMLDRIGFLTEKLVNEEKRQETLKRLKAQSELTALKAQVNAHFIFNVLNIIHEDAQRNQNGIIAGIVESLSSMIRYSMAPDMLTTVNEEIESVNRYVYIQKIRYGSHFEFYYEVEESAQDVKILRLVIQPLVENAIEHGLFSINGGKVYLSVYTVGNVLHICVTDDGIGMKKSKVKKLTDYIKASEDEAAKMNKELGFGVAVRNIYQRMKTYYGDGADMRFVSDFMNGTTVELTIPLERKENAQ